MTEEQADTVIELLTFIMVTLGAHFGWHLFPSGYWSDSRSKAEQGERQ